MSLAEKVELGTPVLLYYYCPQLGRVIRSLEKDLLASRLTPPGQPALTFQPFCSNCRVAEHVQMEPNGIWGVCTGCNSRLINL
jgi:hypothetical protein